MWVQRLTGHEHALFPEVPHQAHLGLQVLPGQLFYPHIGRVASDQLLHSRGHVRVNLHTIPVNT